MLRKNGVMLDPPTDICSAEIPFVNREEKHVNIFLKIRLIKEKAQTFTEAENFKSAAVKQWDIRRLSRLPHHL